MPCDGDLQRQFTVADQRNGRVLDLQIKRRVFDNGQGHLSGLVKVHREIAPAIGGLIVLYESTAKA